VLQAGVKCASVPAGEVNASRASPAKEPYFSIVIRFMNREAERTPK
jgi:hypothetical protein